MARLTSPQPSRAMSADSSRSFDSHDQPSPIFSQSMPPSAAAAFASPTFHLPDLTNWKTPQRYPRAHERISIPNGGGALALARAGDDDHQRPVAGLAALGLGAAPITGTMRDVDAVGAVAGERALSAHAALLEGAVTGTSRWTRPPAAAARALARPTRTGPSSVSTTSTAVGGTTQRRGRARDRAVGVLDAAIGEDDGDRAAGRVAQRLAAHEELRGESPAASGVRPPVGSEARAAAARSSGAPGAIRTSAAASRKATTATRSRRA